MKKIILVFGLFFSISWGCEKDSNFIGGGPVSVQLGGKWKLTKIVSPKSIITDSQIGYTEIIEIGNDNVNDTEKIYRNDKLLETYYWDRSRQPDESANKMTVLMRYSGNKERFYKILNWNVAGKQALEASDYLEKVGSKQDTVTYYYSIIK